MTKEEFKFILDRQQSSGLSVRDFCENEALASYVLGQIQLLYKIERSADQDNLNYDQRADLRKRLALPIWDALEK